MTTRKQSIIAALDRFMRQRPGLDYGNYGDPVAYRAEARSIAKDLAQAKVLLSAVELRDSISADDILAAAKSAFSGRLSISEDAPGTESPFTIDYCVGQYWPTEYRKAVCAVLSSVLWAYWREHCMPEGSRQGADEGAMLYRNPTGNGFVTGGDWLRTTAAREFGRGIASRWFN